MESEEYTRECNINTLNIRRKILGISKAILGIPRSYFSRCSRKRYSSSICSLLETVSNLKRIISCLFWIRFELNIITIENNRYSSS